MNSKASPTRSQSDSETITIREDQVVGYLRRNPDFFARHDDLLAEISLPHDSGSAISLLERQVNILRARGTEARQKLNNLLENARYNDQLFDTIQNLVLALLGAADATEIAEIAQRQVRSRGGLGDLVEQPEVALEKQLLPRAIRRQLWVADEWLDQAGKT